MLFADGTAKIAKYAKRKLSRSDELFPHVDVVKTSFCRHSAF